MIGSPIQSVGDKRFRRVQPEMLVPVANAGSLPAQFWNLITPRAADLSQELIKRFTGRCVAHAVTRPHPDHLGQFQVAEALKAARIDPVATLERGGHQGLDPCLDGACRLVCEAP